jgi:RAB protein geranylgeranyltransferase component A
VNAKDESGNEVTAKAKMVVGSAEYFPEKVRNVGKVVRAIAFLVSALEITLGLSLFLLFSGFEERN